MREGSHYHCPTCGETSPAAASCHACSIPMIDERGNPPLQPPPRSDGWIRWVIGGGGLASVCGLLSLAEQVELGKWGLGAGSVLMVAGAALWWVPRRLDLARRRARARRLIAAAGEPMTIAGARSGLVRVHGRVEVLEASSFAAFEASPSDRQCWRFAIRDGSGAGLVDDDCFEIWQGDLGKSGGVVEDGARIDVIGHAIVRPAPEPSLATTYRDPTTLCFEGTPDCPVLLVSAAVTDPARR